jgi:hypothetical protein
VRLEKLRQEPEKYGPAGRAVLEEEEDAGAVDSVVEEATAVLLGTAVVVVSAGVVVVVGASVVVEVEDLRKTPLRTTARARWER